MKKTVWVRHAARFRAQIHRYWGRPSRLFRLGIRAGFGTDPQCPREVCRAVAEGAWTEI